EHGPEDEPRLVMLETVQEYARELLEESGEAGDIHHRHLEFFLAQFEDPAPHQTRGKEHGRWLARLEAEHENFRAAMRWAIEHGKVESAARLAGELSYMWL